MKRIFLILICVVAIINANAQCRKWKQVAAGKSHNIAIQTDGTLWAWGDNFYSQLGDSNNTYYSKTPIRIGTASNWKIVSAGRYHSVAIKTDGTLWAWGYNMNGQLGDSTRTIKIVPTQIGKDTNWLSVSAGYEFTEAIKTNGTLWAWGDDVYGQLGDNNNATVLKPKQIGTANNWASVSAGQYHVLAIKTDKSLWAWGNGNFGQVGDGTYIGSGYPVQISNTYDWATVSAGYNHSVALKTDGSLWAWGHNYYGQLGDNNPSFNKKIPTRIGFSWWKDIKAGPYHNIAINGNGRLFAWGRNLNGELGDSTKIERDIYTVIGTANNWASVFASYYHSGSIQNDSSLWTWGTNSSGQLGNGTIIDNLVPNVVHLSTNYTTITGCKLVSFKGINYTTSTVKLDTAKTALGCDSVYNVYNIIVDTTVAVAETQYIVGCDSAIFNYKVYKTAAIVVDTLQTIYGCDSVYRTTSITINASPKRDTFVTACNSFLWNGTYYNYDTVVTVRKHNYVQKTLYQHFDYGAKDTLGWTFNSKVNVYTGGIIPPPNTPYGGSPPSLFLDSSGVLITSPKVDGVVTSISFWIRGFGSANGVLYLDGYDGNYNYWSNIVNFVNPFPNPGQVFVFADTNNYNVNHHSFNQFKFYTTGIYLKTFELDDVTITYNSLVGCDTLETLHLKLIKSTSTTTNISGCNSVIFKGKTYTNSTMITDTIRSVIIGCDSIYNHYNITVYKSVPTTNTTNLSGCGSVTFKSIVYNSSISLADTVHNKNGCDSIYNVTNITVTPLPSKDTFATTCGGINWYGSNYTSDTVVTHHLINYVTATLNEGFSGGTIVPAGWTFSPNISTYPSTYGVATPSLKFGTNNDRVVTSTLSSPAKELSFWLKSQSATGGSFLVEGYNGTSWVTVNNITSYPANGATFKFNATSTPKLPDGLTQFRFTYSKSSGNLAFDDVSILYNKRSDCDSLVVLHFTSKKPTTSTTSVTINPGASYTFNGVNYTQSGSYVAHLTNAEGCDSAATLILNVVSNYSITGNVIHPTGNAVKGATINVNASNNTTVNASGNYSLALSPNTNYSIRPSKNNDKKKANGVSTIDISLIQAHVLKKAPLNSPYKLIAADANNDKKITSIDITYIKRLILGLDTTFIGNRLWAFVDSAYKFPDTTNPFPYKDSISFTDLKANQANQSFIGVKIGDVNYDWNPAILGQQASANQPIELYYDTVYTNNSSEVKLHVKANHFKEIIGMQFGLGFDKALNDFAGIENNSLGIEYGAINSKEGQLSFLWNDPKNGAKTLADGNELFTIVLHKKGNTASSSDLTLNGDITAVEAYDKDLQFHNIIKGSGAIIEKVNPITSIEKETINVSPNPSNGNIIVTILSRAEKKVLLNLLDANGKKVLSKGVNLTKGKNTILLSLQLSFGKYFLSVDGLKEKETKQLLIIQ